MKSRRCALYFSWSRKSEVGRDLGELDDRYPALFEFRRAIWPHYEWARDPFTYRQDVSGFLDHVILYDFGKFRSVVEDATGEVVTVCERESDKGTVLLDDGFLAKCDTLIIVSLDHFAANQHPTAEELAALHGFLAREESCLVVCPHHAIGRSDDIDAQKVEHRHHGDGLVPGRQVIGGFAKSLLTDLGVPVDNRYGLNPARANGGGDPAPLMKCADLDELHVLEGVNTFNLHSHLPHLHIPAPASGVRVLARQMINPMAAPHPFVEAGNRYFNALLWCPPSGRRTGNIFVCDATIWSAAFGGVQSLIRFWQNLARL